MVAILFNRSMTESIFLLLCFCFVFLGRVSLYNPGSPGTHSIDQVASNSQS